MHRIWITDCLETIATIRKLPNTVKEITCVWHISNALSAVIPGTATWTIWKSRQHEEHPGIDLSKVTDIDLGEVLCDGCEDYMDDETEAQARRPLERLDNQMKMNWSPMKELAEIRLKTQQLTMKNTIEIAEKGATD